MIKTKFILFGLYFLLSVMTSIGQEISSEPKPRVYTSSNINLSENLLSVRGRTIMINNDGFPKQIQSFFAEDVKSFTDKPSNLLYEPFHFHFFTSAKKQEKFISVPFEFNAKKDLVSWEAKSTSDNLKLILFGEMKQNGYLSYRIKVKALNDITFTAVNFHIPFNKNAAKFLAGLNQKQYVRKDTVKWELNKNNDYSADLWIGHENLGIYIDFSQLGKVQNDNNWIRNNNASIQVNVKGSSMLTDLYTNAITLKKNEELNFDFNIILTPTQFKDGPAMSSKRFNNYRKLSSRPNKRQ